MATAAELNLSSKVNHPQGPVTVSGSGFAAIEQVTISFDAANLATVQTDNSGSFSGEKVTVPATAQPGPHVFSAAGRTSGDAAQASFSVSTTWGEVGFDVANTNANPYENTLSVSNVMSLSQAWSIDESGTSPAVFGGGRLYIGSLVNPSNSQPYFGLSKVDAATGDIIWTAAAPGHVIASPVLEGNTVFVGSESNQVYALNASTGALTWSALPASTNAGIYSAPVLAKGVLYVGSLDGNLYAINSSNGAILWKFTTATQEVLSPTIVNNVVYASGASINGKPNIVYAINALTGEQLWSFMVSAELEHSPTFSKGVLVLSILSSTPGSPNVIALRARDGSQVWGIEVPNYPLGISTAGSTAFLDSTSTLYALDIATGASKWSASVSSTLQGTPALANGVAYVEGESSNGLPILYSFNTASGELLWSGSAGTEGNSYGPAPVVANGVVYVANSVGPMTAFSLPPQSKVSAPAPH